MSEYTMQSTVSSQPPRQICTHFRLLCYPPTPPRTHPTPHPSPAPPTHLAIVDGRNWGHAVTKYRDEQDMFQVHITFVMWNWYQFVNLSGGRTGHVDLDAITGITILYLSQVTAACCHNLLWLDVLLAGNWGKRYWWPSDLPDHESPLGIERQRHSCQLRLGGKPLWHRGEWDSGPASKGDPWPWHRPAGDCPLCRFEAIGKLLHSTGFPN